MKKYKILEESNGYELVSKQLTDGSEVYSIRYRIPQPKFDGPAGSVDNFIELVIPVNNYSGGMALLAALACNAFAPEIH